MKYEVRCNGLYPMVVEAETADSAKSVYEELRGLVRGLNPLSVSDVTEEDVSPFGYPKEVFVPPVPVKVVKSEASPFGLPLEEMSPKLSLE